MSRLDDLIASLRLDEVELGRALTEADAAPLPSELAMIWTVDPTSGRPVCAWTLAAPEEAI